MSGSEGILQNAFVDDIDAKPNTTSEKRFSMFGEGRGLAEARTEQGRRVGG
jgi:hypothetical protein